MVHTESPPGLLPRFPSWSLVCVGPSSVYSHNTGLLEHFQSGFLSGANFLLPWDVHVRLEHSTSWAYEKIRIRKMGEVHILKIFVGCEYECPRGHRFMMSSADKILRGGSGKKKSRICIKFIFYVFLLQAYYETVEAKWSIIICPYIFHVLVDRIKQMWHN